MKKELASLLKNQNYVIAVISLSMALLFVWIFSTFIGQFISPFGIKDSHFYGTLGSLFNGVGIIGSVFFCLYMIKKQRKGA